MLYLIGGSDPIESKYVFDLPVGKWQIFTVPPDEYRVCVDCTAFDGKIYAVELNPLTELNLLTLYNTIQKQMTGCILQI